MFSDLNANRFKNTYIVDVNNSGFALDMSGDLVVRGEIKNEQLQVVSFITGMILIWSGNSANIPFGWLLCDGTNGTPNLTNRFIVGAGANYSENDTGGSANAVVVSHTHSITIDNGGSHYHDFIARQSSSSVAGTNGGAVSDVNTNGVIENKHVTAKTHEAGSSHSHSASATTVGESGVNKNLPPYYALCYIMKS